MKNISYFKFLAKFPEFIDIDEDDVIKMLFLSIIKKRYWKTRKENPRLLPIRIDKNSVPILRRGGLDGFNYNITLWSKVLMTIHIVDNEVIVINKLTSSAIMTEEEFQNFKRDVILGKLFEVL